jgi:hypothetical protein
MNSVLECLFHTPAFRLIVFRMETDGKEDLAHSVPLSLQRLFTLMQMAPITPETQELTQSFGWGAIDVFMQHDVQEFLRVLVDNLETKMKDTANEDVIPQLLRDKTLSYVRAMEFDYSSDRTEDFYDIQLAVQGKRNLHESFEDFIAESELTGDNQYEIEGKGKVDAVRGTKFAEPPPVLHIHLSRFTYDMRSGGMRKVNDRFEFPFKLDMSPFMAESADRTECLTYELTSVLVHFGTQVAGHYYAFCRPTAAREWYKFNDHEVEHVTEENVMDENFGGPKQYFSAYFLVYVRQSDIERVMDPVPDSELRQHLLDYLYEWKQKHSSGPRESQIHVLSDEDYAVSYRNYETRTADEGPKRVISAPTDITFTDVLPQLKALAGIGRDDPVSLWGLGAGAVPSRRLDVNGKAGDRFTDLRSPALFVSSFVCDPVPGEIPLQIGYYDPSIPTSPIAYSHFAVVPPTETPGAFADVVRSRFLLDADAEMRAYFFSEASARPLSLAEPFSSQDVRFGFVVYQLADPVLKKVWPEGLDYYRAIDLLPEYYCPTFDEFCREVLGTIVYYIAAVDDHERVSINLEIRLTLPITALLRCLRTVLKLGADDSVLLFQRQSGKKTPSSQPILLEERASIQQLCRSRFLYYHVLNGVSQAELANKVMFRLQVMSQQLEIVEQPWLLLPKSFTARTIIAKLRVQGIVPQDSPIRIVQLVGARITGIMEPERELSAMRDYLWRAEIVPEDQVGEEDQLIRVTLTHSRYSPRSACLGTPFLFRMREDEKFADTKARLVEYAHIDETKAVFGYTNQCQTPKNYAILKDDDVLRELVRGQNTMLYVFLPGAHAQAISFWNRGVKIYN